jgi:hypothetical protein
MKPSNLRLFSILILSTIIFLGFFSNPPDGKTGAPGDGICTECHTPGNPNGYTGSVSVSGLPAQTMAGQQYSITVTVSNPDMGAVRGGFQMVALDESNQNAGTLSNAGPSSTISQSGGRSYHEHNPGKNFGGNPNISWTVNWTAPAVQGMETVTFYAAGNITNGNGATSGDFVVTSQTSTTVEGATPPLTVEIINQSDPLCFGEASGTATAQADGGTPPYDFAWSTGGGQAMETNMPAGTHMVTVFDQAGQDAQAFVTLSDPPELQLTTNVVNAVSCNGGNDGILSANATGGTLPYLYIWSNGANGPTASNLVAGNYSVTVEDANGCTKSDNILLTEPDPIDFDTDSEPVNCWMEANGIAEVTNVTGGNPGNYTFQWSDGFSESGTSSIRNNLTAGDYSVTITDSRNCSETANFNIGTPDSLELTAEIQLIPCPGDSTASIDLNVQGGVQPYTYAWSDGNMSSIRTDLPSGEYSVTVTDANDCTIDSSFILEDPDTLEINLDSILHSQCGDASGHLQISVEGGYPPYEYLWNTGDTMAYIDSLIPGEYDVLVTDSLGCTVRDTFLIEVEDELGPNITVDTSVVFLDMNGMYSLKFEDVNFTVTDACSDSITVEIDLIDLNCDDVNQITLTQIRATDEVGNTSEAMVPILTLDTIKPIWTTIPPDTVINTCGGTVEYDPVLAYEDNCPDVTIMQTSGPALPANLSSGEHLFSFTIIDNAGNEAIASWTVNIPPSIEGSIETSDPSCYAASDGNVRFITDDSALVASIDLSPNLPLDSLSAGSYELTVTDTTGCKTSFSFTLVQPDQIILLDSVIVDESANGTEDGSITVSVGGGVSPYQYTWYEGIVGAGGTLIPGMNNRIEGLEAGTYSLVVLDINLCEQIFVFEVGVGSSTRAFVPYQLEIFPNPSEGILQISTKREPLRVRAFNLAGGETFIYYDRAMKTLELLNPINGSYIIYFEWDDGSTFSERIEIIR